MCLLTGLVHDVLFMLSKCSVVLGVTEVWQHFHFIKSTVSAVSVLSSTRTPRTKCREKNTGEQSNQIPTSVCFTGLKYDSRDILVKAAP